MLALIMLLPAFVVGTSANEPKTVFGAQSLEVVMTYSKHVNYEILEEGEYKYIHYTSEPGKYGNNDILLAFTPESVSLYDYPYVRVHYRTKISAGFECGVNIGNAESWYKGDKVAKVTRDGKWHDLIISVLDAEGGAGAPKMSRNDIALTIKPFGAHDKTLSTQGDFDIMYIACFKTREEAEGFTFIGDADPLSTEIEIKENPYYKADDAYIAELTAMTDKRIEEILNSPTEVKVTGTKYYVSANGCDDDDGLTPETSWQTINKINATKLNEGDAVFFKRGDSFRTVTPLYTKSGVTFSAYGSGAKPKIMASVDASGADKWSKTQYENIWVYADPLDGPTRDVGTIVFDGGRAWGIKVTWTLSNKRVDNGLCSNGLDPAYEIDDLEFVDERDLQGNLEFYHNWHDGKVYVYSENGNPGEVFSSIELVDKGHGISLGSNCVIDNLEVYGAGSHGMGGGTIKNVTVQNSTLSWIGGSLQGTNLGGTTRFGNGIESYGSSENYIIRNCYANNVYDCCWTAQVGTNGKFKNLEFYGNVAEYANSGLEMWTSNGVLENVDLHDNITRYGGYGWSHQRPQKDGNFFYGGTSGGNEYKNVHVRNNINYFASSRGLWVQAVGTGQFNFHDNTYLLANDKNLGAIASNPGRGTGPLTTPLYTAENILSAVKTGFEKGGKFYWVEAGYEVPEYEPINGVNAFEDIADNFWGRDYVDFVTLRGLFNGVSATEFSPNGTMTRAMLVTVLGRLSGDSISRAKELSYNDVNANTWFAPYVEWAQDKGIVDAGGSFRPDDKATREELADMLYRYALSNYKKVSINNNITFKDASELDARYTDGVKFCIDNKIISGYEDGSVKPKNSATRTEVSAMLKRFVSYLAAAQTDDEKAIADSKRAEFKGAELRKFVDVKGLRATVDGEKITFTPFTASGNPVISLYDYMSKDITFVDYPYIVIKYSSNIASDVTASLMVKTTASFEMGNAGITSVEPVGSTSMIFDCSAYYDTLSASVYADDCGLSIYPWGTGEVIFNDGEQFVIESVGFFENFGAAENYAK